MPLAIKHLDPILGLDVHLIQPPGPVPPLPVPHPYIGMVFDPMDYVPVLGATVKVNGLPRAHAGTSGQALPPHIPIGGMFVKPPTDESETFLGSATVAADGDPMVYQGLPVLTCQDIGVPAQPHADKKSVPKSLMLPVAQVIPIPAGPLVMVGGPPSFFAALKAAAGKFLKSLLLGKLMGFAMKSKRIKALVGKLQRVGKRISELAHKAMDKLGLGKVPWLRNLLSRKICQLTGHPVDVATGKVLTEQTDFELPGPIPLRWERVWYSTSTYRGPLGHGWHHVYDAALVPVGDDIVAVRMADGRSLGFLGVAVGEEQFDRKERLTLLRDEDGYAIRDEDGLVHRFAPEQPGGEVHRLMAIEDPFGHRIRFVFDGRGRLERIIDSAGRELPVRSDEEGRITAIWGPHPDRAGEQALLASYAYDALGNLAEWKDPLGHAMSFTYRGHLLAKETNRNGLSFYFEYEGDDENAFCRRTWGDGGIYDHKLTYGPGTTLVEDSLGNKTTYHHRGGAVYRTVDALGNETRVERNEFAEVVRETDALGQSDSYERDERGNVVSLTTSAGATFRGQYDERDRLTKATDAAGGEWEWRFDESGNLVARVDPLGRRTEWVWNRGLLESILDPAGGRTSFSYDAAGNLVAMKPPDRSERRWEYDRLGRIVKAFDGRGNAELRERDRAGRLVRLVERNGNQHQYRYDAESNVTKVQDGAVEVDFVWAGMGRLVSRSEAGTTVRFEYDKEERLVAVLNEHGRAYRWTLGPTGQIDEETGFDGLIRRYIHDKAGRVVRVELPGGLGTAYRHDPGGRVVEAKHSDGTREWFGYRIDGHMMQAGNAHTVVRFERDVLGHILKEYQGEDWIEFGYDPRGLVVSTLSSKGAEIRVERNVFGDVMAVRAAGWQDEPDKNKGSDGTQGHVAPLDAGAKGSGSFRGFEARFSRDSVGVELERALPGGVRSRWQRDTIGRPVAQEIWSADRWKGSRQYSWEMPSRIKSIMDPAKGTVRYSHDALGNLTGMLDEDGRVNLRLPDAVGNLFRSEKRDDRIFGPAGQLLQSSGRSGITRYEYDPLGNLRKKIEPDGRAWIYEWDAIGFLTKVVRPDGEVVEFGYDPFGRRIWKKFRSKTTRWIWNGDVPLHEWVEEQSIRRGLPRPSPARSESVEDSLVERRAALLARRAPQGPPDPEPPTDASSLPVTWLFDPDSFSPLGKIVGEASYGIVTDHLGVPLQMFDDAGREVWAADVGIYGELRHLRGERSRCPFRWPGQYEDDETGLYYNRFRYYDPDAGQFIAQDPIGLEGGLRLYAYPRDPLLSSDPLGLTCNLWNEFQKGTKGKYASRRAAADSYTKLRVGQSPWPEGFTPKVGKLRPGKTFHIAMEPGQLNTRPGGFGTFDHISNVPYVRDDLAVKTAWKPDVDRVATYRVKKTLPVQEGPVGPQVDEGSGKFLPGGGSQIEMLVPREERMDYLEFVGERFIK